MSDTDDKTDKAQEARRAALAITSSEPLNNWSHRRGASPTPKTPSDAVTEPSSAQRERVVYLVEDALDTIETIMEGGKEENRLRAAENILDRAGMTKQKGREQTDSTVDIPSDALVQVIKGLANAFGASPPPDAGPQDRTPAFNVAAEEVKSHSHPAKEPVKPPEKGEIGPTEAAGTNEDGTERLRTPEQRKNERKSGLPPSLLRQYGGSQ